jgi:formylglycine-generating enzyme required for sulfatase activity
MLNKVRVLIATTTGPVELLLLTEEDPVIGRSVACIGGTTETADIDPGYHAFVDRPTGVVQRLFGRACYRIDVSGRIDAGSSWQLGILAGHALFAAERLAQEGEPADGILWATGSVRPVDLTVGAVAHVPEKFARSLERLKQEAAAGRRVIAVIPAANAAELGPELKAQLEAHGIESLEVDAVQPLWDRLALSPSATARPTTEPPAAGVARTASRFPGRRAWAAAAAILVAFAVLGTSGLYVLNRSGPSGWIASLKQSAPPVALARRSFKDCDICPEMVEIPEGYFQMGSPPSQVIRGTNETPQHTVRFARPFAMGKFEVTVDQFAAFVDATGYQPASQCAVYVLDQDQWVPKPGSFREPSYPVTGAHPAACVSWWNDAKAYVAWLREKTGKPYRLPSEAEWEYAARAGTTTPYSFGEDDHPNPCEHAKLADASTRFSWRLETCSSNHGHGTAPVGQHRANNWGLHDMHGNLWEWVEDCWHDTYVNAPADGSAWVDGGNCARRPNRGGSWHNPLIGLRVARRISIGINSANSHRGFRVARILAP